MQSHAAQEHHDIVHKEAHVMRVSPLLLPLSGAVAKRLPFKGSDEEEGYWNKGISACAVCDGAAPIFRNKPIAVIGGGDSAMEEALFLTKYGSQVSPGVQLAGLGLGCARPVLQVSAGLGGPRGV
jgi:alkyl hydroperoxide reductase subunit AhpF